ncbi:hypothetical protein [uncultured Tateyamaria sp.]|uniref:hypothetical protein n=1 Tax=uncultured Tateyamaria sp. TaxID=455651 RepID=UPI002607B6EA|nr:hypothetical protein [uncultured Tateyamaria sp.]
MSLPASAKRTARLFKRLHAARPMPDKRGAARTKFVHDRTHAVTLWYDPANAIRSNFGTMTAYRAITTGGDLLWHVVFENGASVYHAQCDDPYVAMTQASEAQCAQRQLMDQWHSVQAIARDLLAGRQAFDVTLEDARHAPMCPLGFRAVMTSAGLFGLKRISGKTAARLMRAEPQIGFVIYAVWKRTQVSQEGSTRRVPFGAVC